MVHCVGYGPGLGNLLAGSDVAHGRESSPREKARQRVVPLPHLFPMHPVYLNGMLFQFFEGTTGWL